MSKIQLATVTSPLNSTEFQRQINENFTKISGALDKQLQRECQDDVVNYMEDVIDMGSNRIINLAKAVDPTDAMRKKEFDDMTANIEQWAEEAKTSAANAKISETNAEAAKVVAVSAANSAQGHEENIEALVDEFDAKVAQGLQTIETETTEGVQTVADRVALGVQEVEDAIGDALDQIEAELATV